MTLRCKLGDTALIVRSDQLINLGKVVRVLRPAGRTSWWVVSAGTVQRQFSPAPAGAEFVMFDRQLLPARSGGDIAPEQIKEALLCPA